MALRGITDQPVIDYYAKRAPEYDALYARPERQQALTALSNRLSELTAGCHVLEIACGTGYWTQQMARSALTVHAVDINVPMLEIAEKKHYPTRNVSFEWADMYALKPGAHDALFGGFIWSHIASEALAAWLQHLHRLLPPGSRFVFVDNLFVEGSSTPLSPADAQGNTYQQRRLQNGESYSILKNFPREDFCRDLLQEHATGLCFEQWEYYWLLQYRTIV